MPTSKRPTRKQAVTKKVAAPKKEPIVAKKEAVAAPKTLGELKAKYLADKAAHPHKEQEIFAQYQKDKRAL
jgi:hypothetical protein